MSASGPSGPLVFIFFRGGGGVGGGVGACGGSLTLCI